MARERIFRFECPKCQTISLGFADRKHITEICIECGCKFSRFKNKAGEVF
ncbi:MAG: hypothetical protein HQ538_06380 [Parcubacteria group bacterium]|nr:hypothetical protein [Parcubacteria group bacterium]